MSKGQTVGYIRVSSVDQNTARQLDGIELDRSFTDKISGKNTDRPELIAAMSYAREGDTLQVHSMDRLARNLNDLLFIVETLTKKGVKVRFVKENLTFTGEDSPMSKLMLSIMGAVAQFERDLIRERQREGIAIAKENGVYKGRKACLTDEQIAELRARAAKGEGKTELAKHFGCTRMSVYRYLKAAEASA